MATIGAVLALLAAGAPADDVAQAGPGETVAIAGGTFTMGTAASDLSLLRERFGVVFPGAFDNEVPAHAVTIRDFRIDRFETTNAQFAEFLAARPGWLPANVPEDAHNGRYLEAWRDGRFPPGQDDHPVVFVTWGAAQLYCRWRGGRLPTEAEWEYVARAGDERSFPWGDRRPTPADANYGESGIEQTTPVGSYPPNDFGVYDLAGNVWEFLYDAWQDAYPATPQSDPVAGGLVADADIGAVTGRRAVRGASFGGSVANLRTRWRDSHVVSNAVRFVGFRCAYPD